MFWVYMLKVFLAVFSILVLFVLSRKLYEGFVDGPSSQQNTQTTHTVNLPLTTTFSCTNMCINARCSKTGQQCLSDIDCPGCQPFVPPLPPAKDNVPGNNNAGKLTAGVTPSYSTLTTDIGTQAKLYGNGEYQFEPAPQANFGTNVWRSAFNQENKLFDKRYKPRGLPNMPDYSKRYSVTGEFIDEGPLSSNAYFS
jgi:hypothetical protein